MFHPFQQLALLAADFGWVKIVFLLVVFVVWIFNNLIGDKLKAKGRPQRPQIPPPQPDLPEGQQPAGQPQLVGEIEEFLKRASRKREERTRRKRPAKVVEKPVPPAPATPSRRLVQSGADQQGFEVSQRGSVAEHVQQHLNTRQFADRAAHLADEDIAKSDDVREAHRKQVFDHKLGRLADTSTAAAPAAPAAAIAPTDAEVAAAAIGLSTLLSNPQNLKHAIVLNEILVRPEHRW